MKHLESEAVEQFLDNQWIEYHNRCTSSLQSLDFYELIRKNPYMLASKNERFASRLVDNLIEAYLSVLENKLFDRLLKDLAVFIAGITCNGHKSTAPGVDLEFFNKEVHYVVSVKSGPNWGNSSQHNRLEQDLKNAVTRLKQSRRGVNVQPVLGICYGKTRTSYTRGYLKVVGQNFWYLISENKNLYTDIIEPIGYKAREHNDAFLEEKTRVSNRFTRMFIDSFCERTGAIDWTKLVAFNSQIFDLDHFLV